MTTFTVTGDTDPFLHVSLGNKETIHCESGAMVMIEDTLDLVGRMTGGIGSALMRRFTAGESIFQQHIEAARGPGDCLLAPTTPGSIQVLEVGPNQRYCIADRAFLAADSTVKVTAKLQDIGQGLLGSTGGFVIMEAGGSGKLVVNGMGSLFTLDVVAGKPITVDNGHVVAWDSGLQYATTVATSGSRGIIGNLVGSMTSGEGVVLKFQGTGKVVICSRNSKAFSAWIRSVTGQ